MLELLKGRNLVNVIGIPSWLYLIWIGDVYYASFILIASVLALGEFYNIVKRKEAEPLRWVGMIATVFIIDFFYVQPQLTSHQLIGCIIFLIFMTFLWELFSNKKQPILNISVTLTGIMYIPLLLGTSVDLRQFDTLMNTNIVLTLVISIWTCDSAAFIFGSIFGKRKIFPTASPNKTWVGSISGLIGSIFIFYIFYKLKWLGDIFNLNDALILGLISGFFGQIGDFAESLLKRDAGIKDSGTLLKGHGGILDRFDSLLFATPLTYLYVQIFINF